MKRNSKGQFIVGNHPKSEFKKGHSKPLNAYKFLVGNTFNKFPKGHIAWCKGMKGYTNKGSFKKGNIPKTVFKKGQKAWNYKGGRNRRKDGYILFLVNGKYLFEHRYICEIILGRFLTKEEVVHHINEIRDDNRPENLFLFPSNKSHRAYHILVKSNLIKPIIKSNLRYRKNKMKSSLLTPPL